MLKGFFQFKDSAIHHRQLIFRKLASTFQFGWKARSEYRASVQGNVVYQRCNHLKLGSRLVWRSGDRFVDGGRGTEEVIDGELHVGLSGKNFIGTRV